MSKEAAETYRRKAAECAAAAKLTADLIERVELLKIAQSYLQLARHVEDLATLPLLAEAPYRSSPRSN